MNMEQWWNDIYGKTEELREKPVPVLFCPPQIHWNDLGTNLGLRGEKPVTNKLIYYQ
jgi:hypothetical protein